MKTLIGFVSALVLVGAAALPAQQAAVVPYGKGCAGAAGMPVLKPLAGSMPVLGTAFALQVDPMPPGVSAVCLMMSCIRRTTPIDLGRIGMPGCELWIDPELFYECLAAKTVLLLPQDSAFLGVAIQMQAIVSDPSVSPIPVIMTPALQCVIGT